ncbi:MAG: TOBE domain-containing protein, partial [Marinosulfonomonas sp.]|nr:TOBE domain-containing protein [Marinosulfonomonas sp.]
RQRVAMGRAIVRKPDVFLFDEPLSNLDAKLRVQMRLEIKQLQKSLGVTALYVTHDQVEAMTLADRMIVMNGGVADQIGAPLEVYKNPQTAFVAGFIGSPATNFLTAGDVSDVVKVGDGTLGIRPEHLELCPPGEGSLNISVLYTEALGAETLIHTQLASGTAITVRQDGQMDLPEAGSNLDVRWQADDVLLFDKNGQRVGDA